MGSLNSVIVEGNLVKSAELSHWPDGTPYMRFTIANNEVYKDQQGEWQSIPSYFDCQCKGKYAEAMAKYLLKGKHISVSGRLKQQRWKDESGQMHSAIVIKVNEISLPPMSKNDGSGQQSYQPEPAPDVPEAGDDMFDGNEVIPF